MTVIPYWFRPPGWLATQVAPTAVLFYSGSVRDLPAGFGAFPKAFTLALSPTPIVQSPTYLRHRAAVAFPSEQNVGCYLPTHRICYPSESGN